MINILGDKKIDYQIIYKEDNPTIKQFGNLNNYKKILKKALKYRNIQNRVERIQDKINQITDIDKLEKIIGVIEDELQ